MNPNMTQSLVSDHIRESRQQAAAARRAGAARSAVRKASSRTASSRMASSRTARRGHWLVRGA